MSPIFCQHKEMSCFFRCFGKRVSCAKQKHGINGMKYILIDMLVFFLFFAQFISINANYIQCNGLCKAFSRYNADVAPDSAQKMQKLLDSGTCQKLPVQPQGSPPVGSVLLQAFKICRAFPEIPPVGLRFPGGICLYVYTYAYPQEVPLPKPTDPPKILESELYFHIALTYEPDIDADKIANGLTESLCTDGQAGLKSFGSLSNSMKTPEYQCPSFKTVNECNLGAGSKWGCVWDQLANAAQGEKQSCISRAQYDEKYGDVSNEEQLLEDTMHEAENGGEEVTIDLGSVGPITLWIGRIPTIEMLTGDYGMEPLRVKAIECSLQVYAKNAQIVKISDKDDTVDTIDYEDAAGMYGNTAKTGPQSTNFRADAIVTNSDHGPYWILSTLNDPQAKKGYASSHRTNDKLYAPWVPLTYTETNARDVEYLYKMLKGQDSNALKDQSTSGKSGLIPPNLDCHLTQAEQGKAEHDYLRNPFKPPNTASMMCSAKHRKQYALNAMQTLRFGYDYGPNDILEYDKWDYNSVCTMKFTKTNGQPMRVWVKQSHEKVFSRGASELGSGEWIVDRKPDNVIVSPGCTLTHVMQSHRHKYSVAPQPQLLRLKGCYFISNAHGLDVYYPGMIDKKHPYAPDNLVL